MFYISLAVKYRAWIFSFAVKDFAIRYFSLSKVITLLVQDFMLLPIYYIIGLLHFR